MVTWRGFLALKFSVLHPLVLLTPQVAFLLGEAMPLLECHPLAAVPPLPWAPASMFLLS